MSESVSVTLPDGLAAELEVVARTDGVTREELLLSAVEAYVAERKFHLLRTRVVSQARKAGFSTDEDVFRLIS